MKLLKWKEILFVLSVMFVFQKEASIADQTAQLSIKPQITRDDEKLRPYPTPDWAHLISGKDYVANKVIVQFNPNVSEIDKKRLLSKAGKNEFLFKHLKHRDNFFVVEITGGSTVEEVIRRLEESSAVKSAEPDYVGHIDYVLQASPKEKNGAVIK